ncbi:MAG: NUDIX hydrolase [Myxococcota bacterium]
MSAPTGLTAEVSSLLERYAPADDREARHLADMRALALADGSCSRDHFVPGHFTASAFVLSPDGGSLLLIHHAKLDRWLQPGGHIEPDDVDLIAAARREVAEEVGLDDVQLLEPCPFDLDIHEIPARKADPVHRHFDVRFLFRAPSLEFRAGSDALAARWVPLDQVSAMESRGPVGTAREPDASVMRAVAKLRA